MSDTPPIYTTDPAKYPNAYKVEASHESTMQRPFVFEPALIQFQMGFRRGEPQFQDSGTKYRWYQVRRQVIDHLLRLISASRWHDHLVLRGSLLLKEWGGDEARIPGDIDWTFIPMSVGREDDLSHELFRELVGMVAAEPRVGNVVIQAEGVAIDDIWTYERASGRRIVFAWKAEGLPTGTVQMDVVFQEATWQSTILVPITTTEGDSIPVWSVTREVSLAWKLLWLKTDQYPQGKDLYDAVLLAERTSVSQSLLLDIFRAADALPKILPDDFAIDVEFLGLEYVDWHNFKLEYPQVEGDVEHWKQRLTDALILKHDTP